MAKKILTPEEFAWQSRTGKKNAQTITNCILWRIIKDNGGKMNVSCEEMKNIPENIIHIEVVNQRVCLTAKDKKIGSLLN